jgi:hypothetical protein
MAKGGRKLLPELVWVILSILLTFLLTRILIGSFVFAGIIDIHLHDTYYVVQRWLWLMPLFFFTTFSLFIIKTSIRIFSSLYSYWILLASGIFLVWSLGFLINKLSQVATTGWSVYPPLTEFPVPQPDPISQTLTNFLLLVQLLILITTVFFAYRLGTSAQKQ